MDYSPASAPIIVDRIARELHQKYRNLELCTQYAWWMLEAILLQNKTTLIAQESIKLSNSQQLQISDWIEKQVHRNTPLQYLIGSVPFASCDILVEPPTLIPRQETEEWCIALIEQLINTGRTNIRILDLCTGSGCIAIALGKALPHATIYASDISDKALALAQKNREHNNVSNVNFIKSDLFSDITQSFDLIVSNPPYIASHEWQTLDLMVTQWEDKAALIAPDNGIGILKKIIIAAPMYLTSAPDFERLGIPQLVVEIGHTQGERVRTLFMLAGFGNVRVTKDMHGNDRTVSGCLTHESVANTRQCCCS